MIRFVVHKAAVVFLASALIVIAGIFAYINLPRESAPEIEQPYIFISTVYPGVGAADVENLVTEVIENELSSLDGLIELTSSSQQSLSFIFSEFSSDITVETALRRVQQRVDRARALLPQDIDEPVVEELSSSSFPMLIFTMSNPGGIRILDQAVTDLEEQLKRVRGVLDVEIDGRSDKEIQIELNPQKMHYYGFSIDDVTAAVQQANIAIPGGILKNEARTYTISVNSEIREATLFEDIIIKSGEVNVPLGQIAKVSFSYADPQTYSRVNGQPAITISITKRSGENIIEIVQRVRSLVDSIATRFPENTRIDYIYDETDYINQIIVDLENNMFSGFVLVMLVTILFLGFVNSLFVSLAIPFSMLLSFTILQSLEITLNMVVLFSLILALGMLVDNGIVIVENIFRHGTMGKSQSEAAIDGASEVALPIITSTITTCLAFLPILFMPDVMGDFMSYVPKTVIIVLLSSLFVALILNPVYCSRFLKVRNEKSQSRIAGNNRFYLWLVRIYEKLLIWVISHVKIVFVFSFALVVTGFMLYWTFGREAIFFPSLDPSDIIITAELPQGTPLEKTDNVVRKIEKAVRNVPASVKNIQAVSGRAGDGDFFSGAGEEYNKGYVRLSLEPFQDRTIKGRTTVRALNDRLSNFTGAQIKILEQEAGPPSGNDISYEIIGDDYEIIGSYADTILAYLKNIKEIQLVETNYEPAKPELNIFVDRKKAAFYNLSIQQIASAIRTAVNGNEISKFRVGGDEYDVVLRYCNPFRSSISDVEYLNVVDNDGVNIPVSSVAQISVSSSTGTIRHRDLQRSIGVYGDFYPEIPNKTEIQNQIDSLVHGIEMPPGYEIVEGTGFEMRQEASGFLVQAFIVAVFLISLVLVAQFNSIGQPVIILISILLSFGGVFWGYLLTGMNFVVIMSGIGLIALAGVAVNNSIVLVDYTNKLIGWGKPVQEAVIEAGKTRMRPVLLTALTTVLGLLPMAFGVSFDIHPSSLGIQIGSEMSEFWTVFAWTMIYGLSFATFMTLILIPAMLSLYFKWIPPKTDNAE